MGKPKPPKAPKSPDPTPIVQTEAPEAEDSEVRRQRGKFGFQRTLLTGALTPKTGKRTQLG